MSKPLPKRRPSEIPCSFSNCGRPSRARGLCGGHYQQWKSGKDLRPLTKHSLTPRERFMQKVQVTDTCWQWIGSTNALGDYGTFIYRGKAHGSHRVSYELFVGAIPSGHQIDHTCHNRLCVNPEHLRPATNKQNQENLLGARRTSRTGIRGVGWYAPLGKWRARVRHNGASIHIGYFETLPEAEHAAKEKRLELFTHNDADRIRS